MYDFQCTKCEHVFEDNIKWDAPPPPCPECGGASEKQITAVTVSSGMKQMSRKGAKFSAMHKERGTKPYKPSK